MGRLYKGQKPMTKEELKVYHKEKTAEWRVKNRDKLNSYMRKRYKKVKEKHIALVKANPNHNILTEEQRLNKLESTRKWHEKNKESLRYKAWVLRKKRKNAIVKLFLELFNLKLKDIKV